MESFSASLPQEARVLFGFRQSLRSWLVEADLEPAARDALVLAVHEAVANGVEHGSGSPVRVEGSVDNGHVIVEITTRGGWVAADGPDAWLGERGRGLMLMRGLTDEPEIVVDDECVTIRLRSPRT